MFKYNVAFPVINLTSKLMKHKSLINPELLIYMTINRTKVYLVQLH